MLLHPVNKNDVPSWNCHNQSAVSIWAIHNGVGFVYLLLVYFIYIFMLYTKNRGEIKIYLLLNYIIY